MGKFLSNVLYRFIKFWVWIFYPGITVHGKKNLPEGATIVVGNHSKMNGPISCELYFPGEHRTWTVGEMMHAKEVPEYSFKDFWSKKPLYIRWFFKGLSYVIAPFSACIFNNADCIGVYHDTRIMTTFRNSMDALHEGKRVIIFPEKDEPHNNIVCEFQNGFVDLARMYSRKYKEDVSFVPLYVSPSLKAMYLGKPVKFDSKAPIKEERVRISSEMMDSITNMARKLKEHVVVPYPNIPKKLYPLNTMTDKAFDSNGIKDINRIENDHGNETI